MDELKLEALREKLTSSAEPVTAGRIAEVVRAEGLALASGTTAQLVKALRDELVGLGPLQQFVDTPGVTDVVLDGHGQIWTDGEHGLCETGERIGSEEQARALARRLVSVAGGRLDEGHPCADGRIGNCRIHAVIPPIAVEGTMISVRVSRGSSATLEQLAGQWAAPEQWLAVIQALVAQRRNLLVSGATGSGKTSLLAAMLSEVPVRERIVIVEDTTELAPDHPHVLHLQGRQGNVEGAGRVQMGQLVRETLRMRPDRLIVGECRGAELRDFLTAMNTGHSGAGGTVHANSPAAVPARLVAMGALAGLAPETVTVQAAAALDAVIHVERRSGQRMPVALSALTYDGGRLQMVPALTTEGERAVRGPGFEGLLG
ncbi:TadA family conjugal transfer-associated ATPase [Nesterenkonia sp. MY13]|uniref:TadA family conjugal transfer-associated ATPase n=1 Tax=Nesterenkonia sedimenti TaxID=1463632 RepID=A0A7X8YEN4_9MICC|nr:TadA family conjugal transfer-associated ATPase [Nesterenkonia sedimenti]NLS11003.1 TadA family conjugal transfer-associated ATPase [Nesterenkonia sedimenti]